VAIGEGDDDAVRGQVTEPGDRIGDKTRLGLLAVGDNWRSGFFEAPDGIANSFVLRGGKLSVADLASLVTGNSGQQCGRAGNAADRFSWDRHWISVYSEPPAMRSRLQGLR
jgi:hypothetical protein